MRAVQPGRAWAKGTCGRALSALPLLASPVAAACGDSPAGGGLGEPGTLFERSDSLVLAAELDGASMDALALDVDSDGDLDVVVAVEFGPNVLLINDGTGRLVDRSDEWLPRDARDSEDIGTGDLDGDGVADLVVASEDDQINELYLSRGGRFEAAGDRLPVRGTSNAVVVADLTGDGLDDIVIGNNGQNTFLRQVGGGFADETAERLPARVDVTQDLELGDLDGDGDLDLVVGGEDANRILINDGAGVLADESETRLPSRESAEETREARLADIDGDGDLDLHFSNVAAFVPDADPANRLLVNDGTGVFADETATRLPPDSVSTFSALFADLDGDGDPDLLTGNSIVDLARGRIDPAPWEILLNDGAGRFLAAAGALPPGTRGVGFAALFHDFDGDGRGDLYLASRHTHDLLLRGRR